MALVALHSLDALLDRLGGRSDPDGGRGLLRARCRPRVAQLPPTAAEHVAAGLAVEERPVVPEDLAAAALLPVRLAELAEQLCLRHVEVGPGDASLRDDPRGGGCRQREAGYQGCRGDDLLGHRTVSFRSAR